MIRTTALALAFTAALFVSGCSTTSSSTSFGGTPVATWTGPVFVSQSPLPASVKFKVIGSVEANAKVGYDGAVTLYPLLAAEAKKLGANAVMNVTDGRRMTAWSFAAAYVSGTAVRVDDPEQLKGLVGTYH
jgi:hypothetical protein